MKKTVLLLIGIAVLGTPANAQVRPLDCVPVFPVVDQTASVIPQDVVAEPAAPAIAAKRRFLGLPFLIPALAGLGGLAALAAGGDDEQLVSPA